MTSPSQPLNIGGRRGGDTRRPGAGTENRGRAGAQGSAEPSPSVSVSASLSANATPSRQPQPQPQQITLPGSFTSTPVFTGTPDLRALRAQYAGATPPPNIPPRGYGAGLGVSGTPTGVGRSSVPGSGNGGGYGGTSPGASRTPAVPGFVTDPTFASSPPSSASPLSHSTQPISGLSATRHTGATPATSSSSPNPTSPPPNPTTDGASPIATPIPEPVAMQTILDLDDLPAEEKARVLGRHLVGREERLRAAGTAASTPNSTAEAPGHTSPSNPRRFGVAFSGVEGDRDAEEDSLSIGQALDSRRSSASASAHANTRPGIVREDSAPFPIPYHAPGADVTHDIYKWHTDQHRQAVASRVRSASFSSLPSTRTPQHPAFEHIHEPGGFRRNYLLLRREGGGNGNGGMGAGGEDGEGGPRVLNNFIDFLLLFGHFAGEDLEEEDSDEDNKEDEEDLEEGDEENIISSSHTVNPEHQPTLSTGLSDTNYSVNVSETTALLSVSGSGILSRSGSGITYGGGAGNAGDAVGVALVDHGHGHSQSYSQGQSLTRSRSRSRRRKNSISRQGTASVTQAVLMLLKSFVGTGVLFLGRAFFNGGLLFSIITFTCIAFISLYSFLLLVKTKFVVSGSFGDIGGILYGPWMRYLILGSIVVSQLGFVAAYTIFVAENLQAFVMGITNCLKLIPVQYFILVQLIVFLPLVLIRDLAKLSSTVLIADAFILCGLVYIFGSEVAIIAERGVAEVKMFNPRDFSLFIGTAVFSFEGIGLVIPITDAMREPHKFPKALTGVMMFLLLLFGGAGTLAYLTFGSEIKTVVLVNLDPHSQMVQAVQFFYALAILLSVPLQLFPAIRILENGLFTRSGKVDSKVKWLKNSFRFAMVFLCTGISWVGAADLDKFVAFIGCFACVPLCYVYPAMLHYKACSRTRRAKLADIALIIFGLLAAAYTTTQTLKLMIAPNPVEDSPYGNCEAGKT